ncbi:hypothetical protein Ahy_A02g006241 isoform D [Arachis hypogaea]|uniref:Uncharacterized protein n=1 Tax=Arachis hypogaea TaxID=3818 RepID=A0A445E9E2_ARAHY|nr:hypothetical protein Ahy_A02g006241 isoform D [Arachis hypogaea]
MLSALKIWKSEELLLTLTQADIVLLKKVDNSPAFADVRMVFHKVDVLLFVVEGQKADYALLPFEVRILVVVLVDGIQICSCLAVSESPPPSQPSGKSPSNMSAKEK